MGSKPVLPDQWTPLIGEQLRFYLGTDELTPADHHPPVDFGIDPDFDLDRNLALLELRTRTWMPSWRAQFLFPREVYVPRGVGERLQRIDTEQFRAYTDEDDRARTISPDTIRRARENRHAREGRQ